MVYVASTWIKAVEKIRRIIECLLWDLNEDSINPHLASSCNQGCNLPVQGQSWAFLEQAIEILSLCASLCSWASSPPTLPSSQKSNEKKKTRWRKDIDIGNPGWPPPWMHRPETVFSRPFILCPLLQHDHLLCPFSSFSFLNICDICSQPAIVQSQALPSVFNIFSPHEPNTNMPRFDKFLANSDSSRVPLLLFGCLFWALHLAFNTLDVFQPYGSYVISCELALIVIGFVVALVGDVDRGLSGLLALEHWEWDESHWELDLLRKSIPSRIQVKERELIGAVAGSNGELRVECRAFGIVWQRMRQ